MSTQHQISCPIYRLDIIEDCIPIADVLGDGWVFRGQADASWCLSSTLEREAKRLKLDGLEDFEKWALRKLTLASQYSECQGLSPDDYFSWFAMLQHHGCKTRLVDFTESFYVALYFAIRDLPSEDKDCGDDNAAIWAVKRTTIDNHMDILHEQLGSRFETPALLADRLLFNAINWPDRFAGNGDPALAVVCGQPKQLTQRMIAQQGLFLAPLDIKRPFQENLMRALRMADSSGESVQIDSPDELKDAARTANLLKIVVPLEEHRRLLFQLRRMNITEANLFPGFDGFARSLNYYAVGME